MSASAAPPAYTSSGPVAYATSGVSTASSMAPSEIPTSILAATSTPPGIGSPYTLEPISPSQSAVISSIVGTYTFPSVLSYTMSGTVPAASSVNPSASYYDSAGGIGVTSLPSSRLATATGTPTIATSIVSAPSGTAAAATPSPYNPNAAGTTVTKNGLAMFILAVTALLL